MGFLFGLWPRFCCFWCFVVCFAVSSGETQVWLGDLRVVVFGLFRWFLCVVVIDLPAQMDMICPCTNVFPAYAHVRTEPLARHRPHSREKKSLHQTKRSGAFSFPITHSFFSLQISSFDVFTCQLVQFARIPRSCSCLTFSCCFALVLVSPRCAPRPLFPHCLENSLPSIIG